MAGTNQGELKTELDLFKWSLLRAIERYETDFSRRAKSTHRAQNIIAIKKIIDAGNDQDTRTKNDIIKALTAYFHDDNYYTGFLDNSQLEDYVIKRILDYKAF